MNDYVAYDTETTYTKERDVRTLGPIAYVRHPETQCYLVSLVGDGIEYVGPPEEAPWDKVAGKQWVAHHAAFDKAVHNEMIRRGLNASQPAQWNCSADLMAYCQAPRALAKAASVLLGKHLNKQVRDDMRGKTWEGLTEEKQAQVLEYALEDSRTCLQLWDEWSPRWPEHERRLSRMTTEMGHRGIAVDSPLVESGIASLKERQFKIGQKIPWFGETNDKGKEIPISSPKALAAECRRLGIDPPESTDSKSDIFDKWAEENAEKAPFVAAIQEWRRTNRLLKVLLAVRVRTIDGIMPYELKYGGASHTMRWSGSSGLNMQNLPRKPYAGVDARALFIPRPRHKFVIADLSQIEVRVILWLAGDSRLFPALESGMDFYEAYARATFGYTDSRPLKIGDPSLRQFIKGLCLGLQFGMAAKKFAYVSKQEMGMEISLEKAERIVSDYRRMNPKIIKLWRNLDNDIRRYSIDKQCKIRLPSGRTIEYFDIRNDKDAGWIGRVERGDYFKKLHGKHNAENCTQGCARDIFADRMLALDDAGLPCVLHAHDEVVLEVPEDRAEEAKAETERIMSTAPEWMPGLPLACEAKIADRYMK